MSTRIFVGGFSYRVRERDIERFCDRYGKIREISMKNKYAFVVSPCFSLTIFVLFYNCSSCLKSIPFRSIKLLLNT